MSEVQTYPGDAYSPEQVAEAKRMVTVAEQAQGLYPHGHDGPILDLDIAAPDPQTWTDEQQTAVRLTGPGSAYDRAIKAGYRTYVRHLDAQRARVPRRSTRSRSRARSARRRRSLARSSSRAGDSGDDGPGEPPPPRRRQQDEPAGGGLDGRSRDECEVCGDQTNEIAHSLHADGHVCEVCHCEAVCPERTRQLVAQLDADDLMVVGGAAC